MPNDDDNDPLIGRVIDGRFTIQSVLGRGGMGVVYRAHQASLERSVALKLMTGVPPEREVEFQRRFFLEAATSAKLKHPNTITVFDYGSSLVDDQRVFFMAMELLEGVPLQKLLLRGAVLAPLRAVHIALQISRSLREAHKAGVVHRDLKPGNVMIVKQDDADDVDGDFVKVLDFGLAKVGTNEKHAPIEGLTKAGTFMGSPRYVAPEQVEGRPVDARADIYSLGCILYRMLSGRVPFDGKSPVEIMLKHLNERVPTLGVAGLPLSLERLVADCLAKDAKDRPPSMDAVMQRLKLIRAELGGTGSGIMMVSDDRFSTPPADVSEPPLDVVDPVPLTRVDRRPVIATVVPGAAPAEQTDRSDIGRVARPRTEDGLSLTPSPRGFEDSTRPTRILGKLTTQKPAQRPWAAITAGVVVGLVVCAALGAWRLGLVERWRRTNPEVETWLIEHDVVDDPALDPALAQDADAAAGSGASTPDGRRGGTHASSSAGALDEAPPLEGERAPLQPGTSHLAKRAFIRVVTKPAGADVLEVQDGLPRLLGVTPVTITWDVAKLPRPRELLLRKDGFKPSAATLVPPPREKTEPVWLDVEATLRAR